MTVTGDDVPQTTTGRVRALIVAPSSLLRRGATQAPLLAALLAVVVAGAALLGTCALLLTTGQEAGLDTALRRAEPRDVAVEVTFRLDGGDPRPAVDATTAALTDALEPVRPTLSTWLTSAVRPLVGGAPGTHGYVVESAELRAHADLVDGRWPRAARTGPQEVAVPVAVADHLGVAPGASLVLDTLRDGRPREPGAGEQAVPLVVVGVFAPTPGTDGTWERDLLHGLGVDPAWRLPTAGVQAVVTTLGPFVAAEGALTGSTVAAERVSVVAAPHLAGTSGATRAGLAQAVADLTADVRGSLRDRVSQLRVRTDLVRTVAAAQAQASVTRSSLVVVSLLGGALAGAALAQAGRLVTARRADEQRLLVARGTSRAQLVVRAAAEALVVALVGAVLAIPLAAALFRALAPAGAGRSGGEPAGGGVTSVLVATVVLTAVVLAGVLVVPSARGPGHGTRRTGVRGRVARTSVELLLVALGVVGYLQLRGGPSAPVGGVDPVLVAAPLLCLVAGTAVALRVVPLVARGAEARARRSPGLVVPLASWGVARREHSTGAAVLLVLATAAATFATSLGATWVTSAQDQADARVGADLAVERSAAPPVGQARALAALTGAEVLPLTDREVTLGSADLTTRLAALDTTRAQEVLRGRPPAGTTWGDLPAALAPTGAVHGIGLPPDAHAVGLTVSGTADGRRPTPLPGLIVVPTVVVETAGGGRQALPGEPVPLDGTPRALTVPLPTVAGAEAAGDVQVVAVDLRVGTDTGHDTARLPSATVPLEVDVTVVTDADATVDGWSAVVAADSTDRLRSPDDVATRWDATGVTVTGRAALVPISLLTGDAGLVLTAFDPPPDVPVVVSGELATRIAAVPGDALSMQVGSGTLVARVSEVAPARAAFPRGAEVLADHDTLTRAAVAQGSAPDLVDAWWVVGTADPRTAAAQVAAAGLGQPETRLGLAAALRDDPLAAGVLLALRLLVVTALVLAVAGTALQTAAALDARALDVARLQGMGVPRRAVLGSLLVEHGVVGVLVVAAGGGVGWLVALTVGPLLVVAPSGEPPVPPPVPVWSWPTQLLLLVPLVTACAVVVAPVAARLVRRATAAHLRLEAGS